MDRDKILEWAGFKHFTDKHPPIVGFRGISYENGWIYPDGYAHYDAPNFPQDVSACFRWLEPELYRRGYRYQLARLHDGHRMEIVKPKQDGWAEIVAEGLNKEASMAFCLAIEELK